MEALKILLPFFDDTTLMSACLLHSQFAALGAKPVLGQIIDPSACLSERQKNQILNGKTIEFHINRATFFSPDFISQFDAIMSSRLPWMNRVGQIYKWNSNKPRPAFVSHFPGLDFSPNRGYRNRLNNDVNFFNTESDLNDFKKLSKPKNLTHQLLLVGNPYFSEVSRGSSSAEGICFLTQSISPKSKLGRTQILNALLDLAKNNPDTRVSLKLRHLEDENTSHLHIEEFSYQKLLKEVSEIAPSNFEITAASMDECIKSHSHFLTTSSSGLVQAWANQRKGVFIVGYDNDSEDYFHDQIKRTFSLGVDMVSLENLNNFSHWKKLPTEKSHLVCDEHYLKPFLEWLEKFREDQKRTGARRMLPYRFPELKSNVIYQVKKLLLLNKDTL